MPLDDILQRWQSGQVVMPTASPRTWYDRTSSQGIRTIGWVQDGYDAVQGRFLTADKVVWTFYPDGTATWWDEGWTDGRTDLSTLHRFTAEELQRFRVFGTFTADAWDHFPFTQADRDQADTIVRGWEPAVVFSLYYGLWTFDPPPCGGCSTIKPVEGFTPRGLYDPPRRGYGKTLVETFNWGVLQGIWRLRTDLRQIRDPQTGGFIDGIVDPTAFPQIPCNVSCSPWDVYVQVGMSILTIGTPVWASTVTGLVQAANFAVKMQDALAQARAFREFADLVNLGIRTVAEVGPSIPSTGVGPMGSDDLGFPALPETPAEAGSGQTAGGPQSPAPGRTPAPAGPAAPAGLALAAAVLWAVLG